MPTWLANNHYLTLGLLLTCTVVGIIVAARFRREVDEDLAPPTRRDLLDPLEDAYYSGLMRPEEIERVRESVSKSGPTPASATVPATAAARPGRGDGGGFVVPPADAPFDPGPTPTHHAGDGGSDAA